MGNRLWTIYMAQTVATEEAGQIIGFDKGLILDLALQLVSTLLLILGVAVIVMLPILAIIVLRIYIKKNRR